MQISTESLFISHFDKSYEQDFINFFLNEKNTKYLFLEDEQKTPAGAAALFDYVVSAYETDHHVDSYVITNKYGDFIGSCGFAPFKDSYEFYYSIDAQFTGKGYATETAKALMKHCFENLDFKSLYAQIIPENIASEKVALKCDLKYIKDALNENNQKVKIYKIENTYEQ